MNGLELFITYAGAMSWGAIITLLVIRRRDEKRRIEALRRRFPLPAERRPR